MKCSHVHIGGVHAIVCGGRRYNATKCACGKPATKLCDWIVERSKSPAVPRHKTCDTPMCDEHAYSVPRETNKELCPEHRAAWALHPKNPKQQGD